MLMKKLILALAVVGFVLSSPAAIQTKTVEYKDGDTTLEGVIVFDDAVKAKRPGVLIVHQWKGLSDYEKKRAEMIAQLGYVAFCADIYGKGVRPATVPLTKSRYLPSLNPMKAHIPAPMKKNRG